MKKTLICLALFCGIHAHAQQAENIKNYMDRYSHNWNSKLGETTEASDVIGKPMPAFDFGKGLSSKALRGKTVVLTFWATWCGGCRLLCEDLDSVMYRHDSYPNVQVIGVDSDERLVDKGYKAMAYWKEKGIAFPTTQPGKAADACGKSIDAGHPTTVVIDGDGIVRGRWDAWSPGVAGDVALAAWALSQADTIPATIDNARRMLATHHPDRALYLLDQMPADTLRDHLRMIALIHYNGKQDKAMEAFDLFEKKYKKQREVAPGFSMDESTEAYTTAMDDFAQAVLEQGSDQIDMLERACRAARQVANASQQNYAAYERLGLLYRRMAGLYNIRANGMLKQSIAAAKEQNAEASIIERMQQEMTNTTLPTEYQPSLSSQRMAADKEDQDRRMKNVKK